jgi:hypothetical protein
MKNIPLVSSDPFFMCKTAVTLLGCIFLVCCSREMLQAPIHQELDGGSIGTNHVEVLVKFVDREPMRLDDIRRHALATLATNGHDPQQITHCTINVRVSRKSANGCAVILQNQPTNMLYSVAFDQQGNAKVEFAGPGRHSTPKFGERVGPIPKGGVRER